jgi:hypothetical protein
MMPKARRICSISMLPLSFGKANVLKFHGAYLHARTSYAINGTVEKASSCKYLRL